MKIIIAGAGEIGYHLARLLADEQQDITLIDPDKKKLARIESKLDVMTMAGNATSIQVLKDARIHKADLLIAATQSETTNITIGILGKKMGAKRSIVRISNPEFLRTDKGFTFESLGIDSMISPAALVTEELINLLGQSGVTDSIDFADGQLKLIGVHLLEKNAPILNKTVAEAASVHKKSLMPVAIRRGYDTIIPRGDSYFEYNDFAYFICKTDELPPLLEFTGQHEVKINNVMIVGGSSIGYLAAEALSEKFSIKLIEQDRNKCYDYADKLFDALIINGDARNVDLLKEENVQDMDAFIAVTGNSETNIMSCLVAKSLGVRQTIALVENMDYIHLSQKIGIDTLINKKLIAASHIFKYVREDAVISVATLHGVDAEILEFEVKKGSKITKYPIRKLNFPKTAIIGGVVRKGEAYTPLGEFKIEAADRVVVFTLPESIHVVERFFK